MKWIGHSCRWTFMKIPTALLACTKNLNAYTHFTHISCWWRCQSLPFIWRIILFSRLRNISNSKMMRNEDDEDDNHRRRHHNHHHSLIGFAKKAYKRQHSSRFYLIGVSLLWVYEQMCAFPHLKIWNVDRSNANSGRMWSLCHQCSVHIILLVLVLCLSSSSSFENW